MCGALLFLQKSAQQKIKTLIVAGIVAWVFGYGLDWACPKLPLPTQMQR